MTPNNGPPRQPPNGSQAIIQQLAKQVSQLNLLANLFSTYMGAWSVVMRDHGKALDDINKAMTEQVKMARGQQTGAAGPAGATAAPVVPGTDAASARAPGRELADAFQSMTRTIPVLGSAMAGLVGAVRGAASAAESLGKALPTVHRVDDPDAREKSSGLYKQIYDRNDTPGGTKVSTISKPDGLQGMASAATAIAGIASAASAASAALQQIVGVSASMVQALAPGTVMAFNLAMRDLTATFGVALQPIVQAGTQFARMLGSVLLPVMENLRPVFQEMGGVFLKVSQVVMTAFARMMSAMQPAIDAFADLVVALEPLFEALVTIGEAMMSALSPMFAMLAGLFKILEAPLRAFGELMAALSPIFEAFTVVTRGLAEVFASLFSSLAAALGADLKGSFAGLKSAMQEIAKAAILAAAALAKMLGFDSAIQGMLKALSPERKDATGLASMQNPTIGDFNAYQQAVTKAALLAGGQGGPNPEEEQKRWRNDVAASIRELVGGQQSLETIIMNAGDRIAAKIASTVAGMLPGILPGGNLLDAASGGLITEAIRAARLDAAAARLPGHGAVPGAMTR